MRSRIRFTKWLPRNRENNRFVFAEVDRVNASDATNEAMITLKELYSGGCNRNYIAATRLMDNAPKEFMGDEEKP